MACCRLVVGLVAGLVLTACGLEQPSGKPPLELVAEPVTWVPATGATEVAVQVRVHDDAEGVVLEADTSDLVRVSEVRPGKGCELEEDVVTCAVGDRVSGEVPRPVLVALEPDPGTSGRHRLPVSVRTRTSEPLTTTLEVEFVTGPLLTVEPGPEGRAEVSNVGSEPAEGSHLVARGPEGSSYASTFANCRPVVADERTVVCVFDAEIPPGQGWRTSAPLDFEGGEGEVTYEVGVGPHDPEDVGTLGFVDGEAPDLTLEER